MLETLTCPKCGAPLHFENDTQEICYCSHCGTQVKRDLNNKTITINQTIHTIDEAEIEKHKTNAVKTKVILIVMLVWFLLMGLIILFL